MQGTSPYTQALPGAAVNSTAGVTLYLGGTGANGGLKNSTLDDFGILNIALTGTQTLAIYNTPVTAGLKYGLGDMDQLFNLYNPKNPATALPITDPDANGGNTLTWHYSTTGFNQTAGSAWYSGGNYYVQLGALDGVTTAIPEPGTLVLLAAGLAGLLCYAWRKRK